MFFEGPPKWLKAPKVFVFFPSFLPFLSSQKETKNEHYWANLCCCVPSGGGYFYENRKLFTSGTINEAKKSQLRNLIIKGFNVNEDLDGTLHFACENDHHEVVSDLLAHPQINVNQKDPLHFFVAVIMEKLKL
jgi:hypothetical protein